MDETKSRSYRWVADNAAYFFWTIWGAGVGATASVFFNAFAASGEALKYFLGFLGAGMSAVAAFVAARATDAFVDTRKRRRILRAAIVDVRALLGALQVFLELRTQTEAYGRDPRSLASLYSLAQHIVTGAKAPELHEVLETSEDVVVAEHLNTVFRLVFAVFSPAQNARTAEDRKLAALYFLDDGDIERKVESFLEILRSADRQFGRMLDH